MKKFTFEITDKEYEYLLKLEREGYAEYRDSSFETLEDFKKSNLFIDNVRSVDWFLSRNFDGTYQLTDNLFNLNLIKLDNDSWHTTFVLSEFGKNLLKNDNTI